MPPLPMDDFASFVEALAYRLGALEQGGVPDTTRATRWFIEAFRRGALGGWSLDDITFTGQFYARLPDGRSLSEALPAAADNQASFALTNTPTNLATSLSPTTHMNELAVPINLPLAARINLAVSTYTAIEKQRFLHPHPDTMSRHALKQAEKTKQKRTRLVRWQRMGVTSRPRYLNPRMQRKKALAYRLSSLKRRRMQKRQGKS